MPNEARARLCARSRETLVVPGNWVRERVAWWLDQGISLGYAADRCGVTDRTLRNIVNDPGHRVLGLTEARIRYGAHKLDELASCDAGEVELEMRCWMADRKASGRCRPTRCIA